ncbi:hypothetical protein [Longimicrobium sp.]|jgi:AraC-like DNA-binding protein|uniref:hypothetical protein n=1 Tax=Longimicrobium sp. TaxID=2029185 RepID=UPI002F94569F
MQRVVRPLLVLHGDSAVRERVREAGAGYEFRSMRDWQDLHAGLQRSPLTAVALVDPWHPGGSGAGLQSLRDLLQHFRSFTVVAAGRYAPDRGHALREILSWGVADALDIDRESTPAAITRRLGSVQGRSAHLLVFRALEGSVHGRAQALLSATAEVVAAGGQAPELAQTLGADERTVLRWLHRADLPAPRRLMPWIRLLFASELLDDPARSVESVARLSGYAGAASLKVGYRNLVGEPVRALRAKGAFALTAAAFRDELRVLREQAREGHRAEAKWLH